MAEMDNKTFKERQNPRAADIRTPKLTKFGRFKLLSIVRVTLRQDTKCHAEFRTDIWKPYIVRAVTPSLRPWAKSFKENFKVPCNTQKLPVYGHIQIAICFMVLCITQMNFRPIAEILKTSVTSLGTDGRTDARTHGTTTIPSSLTRYVTLPPWIYIRFAYTININEAVSNRQIFTEWYMSY